MGQEALFYCNFKSKEYFKNMSESTTDLVSMVEQTVTGMGYEFVDLEYLPRGMIRVSMDSPTGVGVDDCERVSNQLTHLFTVEEVNYERLEVSSPGVERPLKRLVDWKRFEGALAHVELFAPLVAEGFPEAGRRKLDGRIKGVEGEGIEAKIQFLFTDEKPAKTPAQAARERIALKKSGKKAAAVEPVLVSFTIDQVDRAHLVAELNFKGK